MQTNKHCLDGQTIIFFHNLWCEYKHSINLPFTNNEINTPIKQLNSMVQNLERGYKTHIFSSIGDFAFPFVHIL